MAGKRLRDQIKDLVKIPDLLERLGFTSEAGQLRLGREIVCPLLEHQHSKFTPSFGCVDSSLTIFKCFGCGKSGDIFTFHGLLRTPTLDAHNQNDFLVILRELGDLIGTGDSTPPQPHTRNTRESPQVDPDRAAKRLKILDEITNLAFDALWKHPKPGADEARAHFEVNHWKNDVLASLRLGILDLETLVNSKRFSPAELKLAGFLNDKGGKLFWFPRLFFPLIVAQWPAYALCRKLFKEDPCNDKLNLHTQLGIGAKSYFYNQDALTGGSFYLAEGISDTITLLHWADAPAIGILGVEALPDLSIIPADMGCILAFDNDPPVQSAVKRVGAKLIEHHDKSPQKIAVAIPPHQFNGQTCKDWTDLSRNSFNAHDFQNLNTLLYMNHLLAPFYESCLENTRKKPGEQLPGMHFLEQLKRHQEDLENASILGLLRHLTETEQQDYIRQLHTYLEIDGKIIQAEINADAAEKMGSGMGDKIDLEKLDYTKSLREIFFEISKRKDARPDDSARAAYKWITDNGGQYFRDPTGDLALCWKGRIYQVCGSREKSPGYYAELYDLTGFVTADRNGKLFF